MKILKTILCCILLSSMAFGASVTRRAQANRKRSPDAKPACEISQNSKNFNEWLFTNIQGAPKVDSRHVDGAESRFIYYGLSGRPCVVGYQKDALATENLLTQHFGGHDEIRKTLDTYYKNNGMPDGVNYQNSIGGEMWFENGILKWVSNKSGSYHIHSNEILWSSFINGLKTKLPLYKVTETTRDSIKTYTFDLKKK